MNNFKKVENEIQLLTCLFSSDDEKAPDNVQLDLINFESDNGLKVKVQFCIVCNFLWGEDGFMIQNTANFKDLGWKILLILASTHNCE
jgi:hypothetical protein